MTIGEYTVRNSHDRAVVSAVKFAKAVDIADQRSFDEFEFGLRVHNIKNTSTDWTVVTHYTVSQTARSARRKRTESRSPPFRVACDQVSRRRLLSCPAGWTSMAKLGSHRASKLVPPRGRPIAAVGAASPVPHGEQRSRDGERKKRFDFAQTPQPDRRSFRSSIRGAATDGNTRSQPRVREQKARTSPVRTRHVSELKPDEANVSSAIAASIRQNTADPCSAADQRRGRNSMRFLISSAVIILEINSKSAIA